MNKEDCSVYLNNFIPPCRKLHIHGDGNCFYASILHQLIASIPNTQPTIEFSRKQNLFFKVFFLNWLKKCIADDFFTPAQLTLLFPDTQLDINSLNEERAGTTVPCNPVNAGTAVPCNPANNNKRKNEFIDDLDAIKKTKIDETPELKINNNIEGGWKGHSPSTSHKEEILQYIERNYSNETYADAYMIQLMCFFLQTSIQIITFPVTGYDFRIIEPFKHDNLSSIPFTEYLNNLIEHRDEFTKYITIDEDQSINNIILLLKKVQLQNNINNKRHLLILFKTNHSHYNTIISNTNKFSLLSLQKVFYKCIFGIGRDYDLELYYNMKTKHHFKKHIKVDQRSFSLSSQEIELLQLKIMNIDKQNEHKQEEDSLVNNKLYVGLTYKHIIQLLNNEELNDLLINNRIDWLQNKLRKIRKPNQNHYNSSTLIFTSYYYEKIKMLGENNIDNIINDDSSETMYDANHESFKDFQSCLSYTQHYISKSMCPNYPTIFHFDQICIPIHLKEYHHWTLVYLDMKCHSLVYYDSLEDGNDQDFDPHIKKILALLLKWIQVLWIYQCNFVMNLYVPKIDYDAELWYQLKKTACIPRQQNSVDCGMFVLMFIETICYSDNEHIYIDWSQKDMENIRQRIALDFLIDSNTI